MLKNQKPIIVGAVAGLVVVTGVAVVLLGPSPLGGSNNDASSSMAAPIAAQAGPSAAMNPAGPRAKMPPSARMMMKGKMAAHAPGMRGMPGAGANRGKMLPAAGKPGAVQVASTAGAPPAARPDPFLIPGTNGPVNAPKPPVASLAPTHIITNWRPTIPPPPPPPATSSLPGSLVASLPGDRVAGIMMNNGVYAIMETNGQSQVVQPGDTLPGGERVVSIQSDSVTLRTTTNQTVNLSVSAGTSAGSPMGYPGGMPASYNVGGGPPDYGRE